MSSLFGLRVETVDGSVELRVGDVVPGAGGAWRVASLSGDDAFLVLDESRDERARAILLDGLAGAPELRVAKLPRTVPIERVGYIVRARQDVAGAPLVSDRIDASSRVVDELRERFTLRG